MKANGSKRPTWAEIDLNALEMSLNHLKTLAPNAGILAMVKANAYGHGVIPVSQKLVELGVAALGVATVEEGAEIRGAGIDSKILVFGGLLGEGTKAANAMVLMNLTPVVHSPVVLEGLSKAAGDKNLNVHVMIDTGMGRLGMRRDILPGFFRTLKRFNNINIDGVITHLSNADDAEFSQGQIEEFASIKREFESEIGNDAIWHFSNSAWLTSHKGQACMKNTTCWVRPGLSLYGIGSEGLQPVMSLKSRIALIKHVPEDSTVSYGCTWKAGRRTRLGAIPIGYADGYPWSSSGTAFVLIRGKKVPIVGRVTMDMVMVDITDYDEIEVGDLVTLMGKDGDEQILADDIANFAGTISYEVISGISPRVPRRYV